MGPVLTLEYFIEEGGVRFQVANVTMYTAYSGFSKKQWMMGISHPRETKSGEMLPTILVLVDF